MDAGIIATFRNLTGLFNQPSNGGEIRIDRALCGAKPPLVTHQAFQSLRSGKTTVCWNFSVWEGSNLLIAMYLVMVGVPQTSPRRCRGLDLR